MPPSIAKWFETNGWQPFAFQHEVWDAYLTGESGLIHCATGSGKTLAAWFGPVIEWLNENPSFNSAETGRSKGCKPLKIGHLKPPHDAPPLTVLWITPMRALAADTVDSMQKPITQLGLPWTVGLRTGDTSTAMRAKQNKRMPSALVTTPESLCLMLSQRDAEVTLSTVRCVVVDEWHELLGTKRGVQVELALARLRHWNPRLRVWGLSATLGNLEQARDVLLAGKSGRMVAGVQNKRVVIDTLIPANTYKFPWAGHLGLVMVEVVAAQLDACFDMTRTDAGTALVFTNTRSQAEIWYQALLEIRPMWAGELALHHGSLDKSVRQYVEDGLKSGVLRAVVATSSLDLGVDFSPVGRVLQIGSPKGVARLLQRAGRSGHAPGQVSRISCVPSHAFEFIEAAAARAAANARQIESRRLIDAPLDVLVQHLVTLALGDGFIPVDVYPEIKTAYAYRNLTPAQWQWALDFITRGGDALQAYPEYKKVVIDAGIYVVRDTTIARRHRMNVGTIVSDAMMEVRYANAARLGYVEESFIARLKIGDAFTFAGRTLALTRIKDMTAYVKPAAANKKTVPTWGGGKMPLSSELAAAVRKILQDFKTNKAQEPEVTAISRMLLAQQRISRIPDSAELLIEQFESKEGHHIFMFPFAGRHVHTGLAALLSYRLSLVQPATFSMSVNDYGLELLSVTPFTLNRLLLDSIFSATNLLDDVLKSINAAELSKRHFREVARVAGLVFQGFPGASKTNKQVQASSGLIYDVFAQWDEKNPLLAQSTREVLERELEFARLTEAMARIKTQRLTLIRCEKPTPFAFPLMLERLREKLSSEKLADRVQRMQMVWDD